MRDVRERKMMDAAERLLRLRRDEGFTRREAQQRYTTVFYKTAEEGESEDAANHAGVTEGLASLAGALVFPPDPDDSGKQSTCGKSTSQIS